MAEIKTEATEIGDKKGAITTVPIDSPPPPARGLQTPRTYRLDNLDKADQFLQKQNHNASGMT